VTYRDFSEKHFETTQWAPERTFIAYSFSKSCGMAGMRIGALAAPKDLMDKVMPYNTNDLSVNVVAQRGALAALQTKKEWFPKTFKICCANQRLIRRAVRKVEGARLPVFPSQANMFCIDISATGVDPDIVEQRMLFDHNVFIRSGNYVSKQFGSKFIRASFSVMPPMARRFAEAFPAVMEQLRNKEPPAAVPTGV
jgi:aspartate/methionine/tyrosine aminotransferase